MYRKEFILCAAIWYDDKKKHDLQPKNIRTGFVVAGRRHADCYATVKALLGIEGAIELKKDIIAEMENKTDHNLHQGFLTSANRYVGREEAFRIAKRNSQLKLKYVRRDTSPELYSEDLY